MTKTLSPLLEPKAARSPRTTYGSVFGSKQTDPGREDDQALVDFIVAATPRRSRTQRGQGASFENTEWLCTQWPDTSFEERSL